MMFIQGEEIEIPEIPEKNTNCQAVKRFLDEYARLSFLETEDTYYGSRPAFRDLMSFCFQPQNVVANANITTLRERIAKLKKIADESVIKMKIENAITKISVKQMELLKLMDAERPDDPFRLDYKNLTVEVDGEDGRKDYLWEIGSGSNWLRRNIRCGIGAEGDNSSAYPRFTLRSRIMYCKLGNIRKKLRLLLMI